MNREGADQSEQMRALDVPLLFSKVIRIDSFRSTSATCQVRNTSNSIRLHKLSAFLTGREPINSFTATGDSNMLLQTA